MDRFFVKVAIGSEIGKVKAEASASQHDASSSAWGCACWALICQANEPGASEFWFTPCNYNPGFAFTIGRPPSLQPNHWLLPGSRRRRNCRNTKAKQMQAKQVHKPAVKWEEPLKTPFATLSMWFNCAVGQCFCVFLCFTGSPTNK